jgi:hypothetical protein
VRSEICREECPDAKPQEDQWGTPKRYNEGIQKENGAKLRKTGRVMTLSASPRSTENAGGTKRPRMNNQDMEGHLDGYLNPMILKYM